MYCNHGPRSAILPDRQSTSGLCVLFPRHKAGENKMKGQPVHGPKGSCQPSVGIGAPKCAFIFLVLKFGASCLVLIAYLLPLLARHACPSHLT